MEIDKYKVIAYEELVSSLEEICENYLEEYKQALINEQIEAIAEEFKKENNIDLGVNIQKKVRAKEEIERDITFFARKRDLLRKQQENFLQE